MPSPSVDAVYLQLLSEVLQEGEQRGDRTGVGTRSIFGRSFTLDLQDGFPVLTTKRVFFKSVVSELRWFLSGESSIASLLRAGNPIWTANAMAFHNRVAGSEVYTDPKVYTEDVLSGAASGDVGYAYGPMWRGFPDSQGDETDQISALLSGLRTNPNSRRHMVSAWNPAMQDDINVALPPCHVMFQCYVREGKYLDIQVYQRSADIFLGLPFNIASYALLTHLIARVTGLTPGRYTHVVGDLHLYNNHEEAARTQLSRDPAEGRVDLVLPEDLDARLRLPEDFNCKLEGYNPHPAIPVPMAV